MCVAILKAAEKWKLRFDYNVFLFPRQDTMTGALLHYAHSSKWIFLFPQNASVCQSRSVLKDRMDTLVMKGSIILSVL